MNPSDGRLQSLWYDDIEPLARAASALPESTEVCVVGGGIAGLTTAYLLAGEGERVLVVDEGAVGSGQTGRTSAHLASAIDDRFVEIERMHGEGGARLAHESHAAAIDLIESIARIESIDCDFVRVPAYLLGTKADEMEQLELEAAAARRAGMMAEALREVDIGGYTQGPCVRFENQARFHPLKYLQGLARAAEKRGVVIASGHRVTEVRGRAADKDMPARVITSGGQELTADSIVVATNVPGPVRDWAGVYFKQAAYRSYVVAFAIEHGAIEDALWWDTLDPYHYVRLRGGDGTNDVLIVGGEDHKTGQLPEGGDPFTALETWARETFPACREIVGRWSGQVQEPTDGLGFIGRAPTKGKGVYVITGDSGMGLTHGTLGARLVTDLVLGRHNAWEKLYDPERKPMHSLGDYAQENLNTAAQWIDRVTGGDVPDEAAIHRECGALVRDGLKKLAVFRDEHGVVHRCSAVCPHLGAIVHWNPIEQTWDCPAHGSRFSASGALIVGPATADLEKAKAP